MKPIYLSQVGCYNGMNYPHLLPIFVIHRFLKFHLWTTTLLGCGYTFEPIPKRRTFYSFVYFLLDL